MAIKLKIAERYGDAMWYQNVIAAVEILGDKIENVIYSYKTFTEEYKG